MLRNFVSALVVSYSAPQLRLLQWFSNTANRQLFDILKMLNIRAEKEAVGAGSSFSGFGFNRIMCLLAVLAPQYLILTSKNAFLTS
jgi:hypothetical protein